MSKLVDFVDSIVDNRGKNPPYYSVNYEYPVIDNFLINGERYPNINRVKRFIDKNVFDTFIRKYLKKDDVVITLVGNGVGSCCLVPADNWVIIQNTIGLKTKPSVYNRYLYYYLKLNKNRIALLDGGSSQPNVRVDNFLQIEVNFQNFDEQKKIAETLYILDSKIELNNRINAELEAMAKTLYDYWFVQFDFPDKNGKPYKSSGGKMVWNEELKREIPEGWEVKELRTEIEIQRGISYTSKEINGQGIPMINLNSFNLDGTYKSEGIKTYSGKYSEKNIVKSGDLLIAATDVTRNADIIGRAILVPDYYNEDLVFSMDIAKIISNKIPSSFLMMLFNSNHYHNYIKWYATGTLVLHLNLDGVNRYQTEIPSPDLLKQFDDFYLPIANRVYMTAKENQKLTELRDWLLPMLMNGQVKVKDENETELSMAAKPKMNYGK